MLPQEAFSIVRKSFDARKVSTKEITSTLQFVYSPVYLVLTEISEIRRIGKSQGSDSLRVVAAFYNFLNENSMQLDVLVDGLPYSYHSCLACNATLPYAVF